MTIKEVEQKSGISKQNIRFYEKEGLIAPFHNPSNGYREYTDDDVFQLKRVKLFRKLGISIDDILKMQQREVSVYDCMLRYSKMTAEKIEEMKKQRQFLDKIAKGISENDFDIEKCLDRMEEEEKNGVRFFNIAFDFLTKAKNHLGKGAKELMKKRFNLSPEDSSHYPSSREIRETILRYCSDNEQKCEFVDQNNPFTFRLDGALYRVIVYASRVGYYLSCMEL